jgi:predicted nucleic acid-binding protein
MAVAIDTNVITALWNEDNSLNQIARKALDAAFLRGRMVVSGVVYAELLAAPSRTEQFVERFMQEAGIEVEWEISEMILRTAGSAFRGYAERRRKQRSAERRRILADFLIGAHAMVKGHKLLTLDAGMYRAAFPRLQLADV